MEFGQLFSVYVSPNKAKTQIRGFDEVRNAFRLEVAARPKDGKANQEIVKYFRKEHGINVSIIFGLTSKKKILKVNKH